MARSRPQAAQWQEIKQRIARRLSDYRVARGDDQIGLVTFSFESGIARTFRAHWTGFKLFFPKTTMVLRADLTDGRFWTEGYVSLSQPSWILAFRKDPAKVRGSGGPRPDDKLTSAETVEVALGHRRQLLEAGLIRHEELIRMEDLEDPLDALDSFFNYTSFYVLKAIDATWSQFRYLPDASVGWGAKDEDLASFSAEAAIDESLRKSDILWLDPESGGQPIPCWFVYRNGLVYVLSGERQQVIPGAARLRDVKVVTRWKGRDARMADFTAAVRPITAQAGEEFDEIAELLLAKRQSVTGSTEENIERWKRDCVILELSPRI